MTKQLKTIDQLTKSPAGTFAAFIARQKMDDALNEALRKFRVRRQLDFARSKCSTAKPTRLATQTP